MKSSNNTPERAAAPPRTAHAGGRSGGPVGRAPGTRAAVRWAKAARSTPWLAALALSLLQGPARAQGAKGVPSEAEALYNAAAAAMIKKDYATACPKFEQVTRLVPDGGGVRLNLAECYEESGKLASAYNQYAIAETLAVKDGRKDRQRTAVTAQARLKPKLATLVLTVPDSVRSAPDLVIKLDGDVLAEKVWGVPSPVDKGSHVIVAVARGFDPATVNVDVPADGKRVSAAVPPLVASKPVPTAAHSASSTSTSTAPDEGPVSPGARTAALIGGGALALGGLAAGGALLGVSIARADERRKAELDPFGRDAALSAAAASADMQSAAVGCFIGGGVLAAGTVAFYLFTRPRAKAQVKTGAFVSPQGASIWIEGVTF